MSEQRDQIVHSSNKLIQTRRESEHEWMQEESIDNFFKVDDPKTFTNAFSADRVTRIKEDHERKFIPSYEVRPFEIDLEK